MMTNKKIKIEHLLIDVHGVLTKGDERKCFISFMEKKYGMDSKKHNSLWLEYVDKLDTGEKTDDQYIKIINKTFNTGLTTEEYFRYFADKIRVNKLLLNRICKLRNCKTCIVSDNVAGLAVGLNKTFGNYYKGLKKFYSFEVGLIKSTGMLAEVIKLLKTEVCKCLFIDDSEKNTEAAKKLGINTILFRDNKEVFEELKKYDL